MSCGPSITLGVPEPPGDTSVWIRRLAQEPDGEPAPGHSNADLLELHRRPPTPAGAVYREQVAYAHLREGPLPLRIYARACPGERRPAVVLLHGGGWVSGDPSMLMRHAHGLATRGFVTALVSYRLYPSARWPDPLHDARAAVRWVRESAHLLGADPDRIVAAGSSAGGQLAALVGLTAPTDRPGHPAPQVQGLVLWYPVVDVARLRAPGQQREVLEDFFGASLEALPDRTSPRSVVGRRRPPPTLIIAGDADQTTPIETITEFRDTLVASGGEAELVTFPGRGHAFDLLPGDWEPSFRAAADFLERRWSPRR